MININRIILSAKTGTGDPSGVTPDFVGQLYVDTASNRVFFARTTTTDDYEEFANFIDLISSNILTSTSGQTVQDFIDSKGQAGGLAELDPGGKIPSAQIPPIAITNVFVVADIPARDALTVETGDVVKVADDGSGASKTYMFDGTIFIELKADDNVDAVNGQTGIVLLGTDDIGEGITNLYYTDTRVTNHPDVSANTTARHTHPNKTELDLITDGDHDVRTDNPHNIIANQIDTDESGKTVQDKLDEIGEAVPIIKSGLVDGSEFFSSGGKQIATITFATPFPSGVDYAVTVDGTAERTWSIQNKTQSGFTINSGSNKTVVGESIGFHAIETGEF